MKIIFKILKWTGIVLVVLVIVLVGSVYSFRNRKFEGPMPVVTVSSDSAVIAHGKALVYGPAHCAHCHTPITSINQVEAGEEVPLIGGHDFSFELGHLFSKNITPDAETGIGNYTDGEIARALRDGIAKDGHAIFDMMPFHNMSVSDMNAIISYIRSTTPIKNETKKHEFNFIGDLVRAFVVKPVGPDREVPQDVYPDSTIAYGEYLAVSVANCYGCHTERNLKTGAYVGEPFAGGLKIASELDPSLTVVTPNLTPDPETGRIAEWSEDQFIKRFRQGKLIPATIMPWGPFSRLSDLELKAIYRFLRTVKPVKRDNGPSIIKTES